MKKLLAILLGLALAAVAAEAKTYYVDASRPNNNGNGLKPATAKRTIQAAVNIAQNGDTILVYPGWYAPIKTNNKNITIKSLKGASKTGITRPLNVYGTIIAQLGKGNGKNAKGTNTSLVGFLVDGRNYNKEGTMGVTGAVGGRLLACCLQRMVWGSGGGPIACNAVLTGCTIRNNRSLSVESSILTRCKIMGNTGFDIRKSRLGNCLVAGNEGYGSASDGYINPALFESSVFVNCTIVKNRSTHWLGAKPVAAYKSRFYNCILRNNYRQAETWMENQWMYGQPVVHNVDAAAVYANTYFRTYVNNRDPKFVNYAKGDYRLTKGSPCIDLGQLNATLKQLVGSCDLSGKKRIRGKNIDMGCYEY